MDREDAAEKWPGLSEQAVTDMAAAGIAPTVHVEDRRAKGWEGSCKVYLTSDDLRRMGSASFIEAADWLDRRAGFQPPDPLVFGYTNWRGEHGTRRAIPIRVYHGSTEYHPEPQWLMEAHDMDKGAVRVFAMKDIGPAQGADPLVTAYDNGVDHAFEVAKERASVQLEEMRNAVIAAMGKINSAIYYANFIEQWHADPNCNVADRAEKAKTNARAAKEILLPAVGKAAGTDDAGQDQELINALAEWWMGPTPLDQRLIGSPYITPTCFDLTDQGKDVLDQHFAALAKARSAGLLTTETTEGGNGHMD